MKIASFRRTVRDYYRKSGRKFPWRETTDPYEILVSEVMLQQTQTHRVVPRYRSFLKRFPTVHDLAQASVHDVLSEWQGLGYNRRALYLKRASETIVSDFGGVFPRTEEELSRLPGLGPYTRGAVLAFAFNKPSAFIETNIRSAFIHSFFPRSRKVSDKRLFPLITEALDRKNPREWYYSLMDYGTHLKQTRKNPSRRSSHHIKQAAFKGSNRELRAQILREILATPQTAESLHTRLSRSLIHIDRNLRALEKEGFIESTGSAWRIKKAPDR